MTYEDILYQVSDSVLTLTLNRPDKLNAFTHLMMKEMMHALDQADMDDNIRAIVVTGAGRAFCAGADLSKGGQTFDYDARSDRANGVQRDGGGRLTLRIFDCKKPIIAAINGPAVGIGATMLLAMDVRLAAENAKFGFVFSRRGIVPEACSSYFLPRIVGISQALEWAYTGKVFPASEALSGGLVRSLHKPETLLADAQALALEFAQETSPVSIALIRQMMWKMLGANDPMDAHKIDSRGIYHMGKSPDCKEGVEAFLAKRPAEFPMKVSSDMPEYYPWWTEQKFE